MASTSLTKLLSNTFNPEKLGAERKPLSEFSKEIKKLTDKDKMDLARSFVKEGYAESVEVQLEDKSVQIIS